MKSRRLSSDPKGQTKYPTYGECLEKACVLDVSHECQLTPNIFTFVGHAGVALMIFESGMHFDFEKAKVVGKWACVVAVLGTILPLITGTLLIILLVPGAELTKDGLSAGTALAPTSVGIALKLLNEAKQLQKDFGQIIITAAFVDDILSLVLFNVLFSMADGELGLMTFLPAICGLILMGLVIVYAATKADVHIEMLLHMMPQNPPKKKLSYQDEFLFFFMMIMVLVFGTVFFYTGTHLWGCFMAGMCLAKLHSAHHVWVKQTKRMTVWMIRIFFSCTVAFSIPVSALLSIGAIWKGALMGIGPCILTKVFCAFFMGEMKFVVGWAMVGRAEFAYLIAQMAAASNMMSEDVFAVVIWSLLWATVFAPFLFRYVLKQFVAMNEERRKKEMGDDYFPEDDEGDGHGGHDDEFRQSGHLPDIRAMYPDFDEKKKYDGLHIGYHYIKNGPEGTGYYKDFIACATKGTKECYDWAEGGLGPGFYIQEEWKQTGEYHVAEYGKGAKTSEVVMTHEKMPSNEKAEKPVTAHMEEDDEDNVPRKMLKPDVSAPFASDADEASEVADRGSGFLCCLFFRKIVIM
jgi:Kef-type K+ transport system membrane component KefB